MDTDEQGLQFVTIDLDMPSGVLHPASYLEINSPPHGSLQRMHTLPSVVIVLPCWVQDYTRYKTVPKEITGKPTVETGPGEEEVRGSTCSDLFHFMIAKQKQVTRFVLFVCESLMSSFYYYYQR